MKCDPHNTRHCDAITMACILDFHQETKYDECVRGHIQQTKGRLITVIHHDADYGTRRYPLHQSLGRRCHLCLLGSGRLVAGTPLCTTNNPSVIHHSSGSQ